MELVPVNVGRQVGSSSHGVAVARLFSSGETPLWLLGAEVFPADCQRSLSKSQLHLSPLLQQYFSAIFCLIYFDTIQ